MAKHTTKIQKHVKTKNDDLNQNYLISCVMLSNNKTLKGHIQKGVPTAKFLELISSYIHNSHSQFQSVHKHSEKANIS